MVTATGDGPRADYQMQALIDIVNRIASMRMDKAILAAIILAFGFALIGACLVAMVLTVKVFRAGFSGYLTPPPAASDIPPAYKTSPPGRSGAAFAMGGE